MLFIFTGEDDGDPAFQFQNPNDREHCGGQDAGQKAILKFVNRV
jgi:hypothetical protein